MPAQQLLLPELKEDTEQLQKQLESELADCTEVQIAYRIKIKKYMLKYGIWHISDLDYTKRQLFRQFLAEKIKPNKFRDYEKAFDQIKQHSIRGQTKVISGKNNQIKYENHILFLPYHPNQELVSKLDRVQRKDELLWDFSRNAPEKMKRQVFRILHYFLENDLEQELLRSHIDSLRTFYDFCVKELMNDIELLELTDFQRFADKLKSEGKPKNTLRIVDLCRKILFINSDEIHWEAHIWYLERLHLLPERMNPSNPVISFSFLEITHKRNRELLKKYMRYGLGMTELTINNLRQNLNYLRSFLTEIKMDNNTDISAISGEQVDIYFRIQQERNIQAGTYNKIVMIILHFFNFLMAHRYIEKIPFCADYYLKKVVQKHHDRSVELKVSLEIIQKLPNFPLNLRLMYLHLWAVGLRVSEVCTLKGHAYFTQGIDAWIQVYQIKMKSYKRIPIPMSLYRLMKVYLKKCNIGQEDYIFKNRKGGAYNNTTFRRKMLKYCNLNYIQNGEYIFQSHDYRHSVATLFYDNGVSLQSVRDYLGHFYEEMTRQYIDYMPKKLADANGDYFNNHGSLAESLIKKKR